MDSSYYEPHIIKIDHHVKGLLTQARPEMKAFPVKDPHSVSYFTTISSKENGMREVAEMIL